jgi:hypothetical protein
MRFLDSLSKVYIKNYLNIYVGTKTRTGEQPLTNASVTVLDNNIKIYSKRTNSKGTVQNLVVTHKTFTSSWEMTNVTNIEVNYQQNYQPTITDLNMSESKWVYFTNHLPRFNFKKEYQIPEDTMNETFLDLWEVVEDDFDKDSEVSLALEVNTGADIDGKNIAGVDIVANRWLSVDLSSGRDNDNWTGIFYIQICATDRLGNSFDIKNCSGFILINVTPINDPPMWNYMDSEIHVMEDTNQYDFYNLFEKVIDVEDPQKEFITFSVAEDYDQTNFYIYIENDSLNIEIKTANYTGSTLLTLIADDNEKENNLGIYTLELIVNPQPDAPAVNKSLIDFSFNEDTSDTTSITLLNAFIDSDGDDLTYNFSGNDHITVSITQANGKVRFSPEPDWFGTETITFGAADPGGLYASNSVDVTVLDVNDPPSTPVITQPAETDDKIYKKGEKIAFTASSYDKDIHLEGLDPDHIGDKLRYTWIVNTTGEVIGINESIKFSKFSEGKHRITVTVTDQEGETASAFVDITIFGEYEPPTVTHLSPLPDFWTNNPTQRLEWTVDADPESMPYLRFDVLMDEIDGTTVVAEKIRTTFFTATDLRDGNVYYWTVIPYISDEPGVDLSGKWFFSYDKELEQIFDLSLTLDPLKINMFPGRNETVDITVTNLGNMPDRYEVILNVEVFIEDYLTLSTDKIDGLGDDVFGLTENEKETIHLYIEIPEDFDMNDVYKVEIIIQSITHGLEDKETLDLEILEIDTDDHGNLIDFFAEDGSILMYVLLLIIVIIIALVVILFAVLKKRKMREEVEDARAEIEDIGSSEVLTPEISGGPEGRVPMKSETEPTTLDITTIPLGRSALRPTPGFSGGPVAEVVQKPISDKRPIADETMELILELKEKAQKSEKPSDFEFNRDELLKQFGAKYDRGEISKEAYDSIFEALKD